MKDCKSSAHRWHLRISITSLVSGPRIMLPFSIAACHGLVEYRLCSSHSDSWSFLKRENSEFGPTEAKGRIKSLSLTSCSLQSIEHCTCLWILHLFLLLHADLHTTSALSLPAEVSPQRDLGKSASLPMANFWLCTSICFYLSSQGTLKSKVAPMIFRPLQGSDGIRKKGLTKSVLDSFFSAQD